MRACAPAVLGVIRFSAVSVRKLPAPDRDTLTDRFGPGQLGPTDLGPTDSTRTSLSALTFTPDLTLISSPCSVHAGFECLLSMYNVKNPACPVLCGRKPESFRNCNEDVVVSLLPDCVTSSAEAFPAADHL
jgi:hypothetical protein